MPPSRLCVSPRRALCRALRGHPSNIFQTSRVENSFKTTFLTNGGARGRLCESKDDFDSVHHASDQNALQQHRSVAEVGARESGMRVGNHERTSARIIHEAGADATSCGGYRCPRIVGFSGVWDKG